MGLCFKYLTIFLKSAKLEKLMHFCHNNERLYVLIILKRLMTGMIWGTRVGPCFPDMGGFNKKYLKLNLLVFIPEMEISELNSL